MIRFRLFLRRWRRASFRARRRSQIERTIPPMLPTGLFTSIDPPTSFSGLSEVNFTPHERSTSSPTENEHHHPSILCHTANNTWALQLCSCASCRSEGEPWFAVLSGPEEAIEEAIRLHLASVGRLKNSEVELIASLNHYEICNARVLQLAQYLKTAQLDSHYDALKERVSCIEDMSRTEHLNAQ
ncbi:hypothetical protein NMY22_g10526 [Coprinellus aureogranulatus]|nr:hypothetical protein NMY22_g10526 [Coprinellus aureogranulatus]